MQRCNRRVITPTWIGARTFSSVRSVLSAAVRCHCHPPSRLPASHRAHTYSLVTYYLLYFNLSVNRYGRKQVFICLLKRKKKKSSSKGTFLHLICKHNIFHWRFCTFSTVLVFLKWQPCKGMSWGCLFKVSPSWPQFLHFSTLMKKECVATETFTHVNVWLKHSAAFKHEVVLPLSGGTQELLVELQRLGFGKLW